MITVYHTNEHRGNILGAPVFAEGNSQWLGDGYYFWQDYEFSEEWGYTKICAKKKYKNGEYDSFDIYKAELDISFSSSDVIDTVFNEEDYYKYLEKIETFAQEYCKEFGDKPTLEEFNDFIADFEIWPDIIAIRFQDLPTKDTRPYLKVKNFFYKKRIQIVLYDIKKITKFGLEKTLKCI